MMQCSKVIYRRNRWNCISAWNCDSLLPHPFTEQTDLPDQPKPSLILVFLRLQPYSALRESCTVPWAPDERLREMTALLAISAPGHSQYICWPAGLCARQSPGPRMGRSRGGLVLLGLEENTSTKSFTRPPNSSLSRYIASEVYMLQSFVAKFCSVLFSLVILPFLLPLVL